MLWRKEAAKRLLPDMNLERKAKKAERSGVGVAKRLALVQADTAGSGGSEHKVCCRKAGGRIGSPRPFARSS